MPSPAPVSTITWWPPATYSRALHGGEPNTRVLLRLISFGTPTRIVSSPCAPAVGMNFQIDRRRDGQALHRKDGRMNACTRRSDAGVSARREASREKLSLLASPSERPPQTIRLAFRWRNSERDVNSIGLQAGRGNSKIQEQVRSGRESRWPEKCALCHVQSPVF